MSNEPRQAQAEIADLAAQITEYKRSGNSWSNNADKLSVAAENAGDGEGVARAELAKESVEVSKHYLSEAKALLDQAKKLPEAEKSTAVDRAHDLVINGRDAVNYARSTCRDAWSDFFGPEPWGDKKR